MKAAERFLNYVRVWTVSDEDSMTIPSAEREFVLANMLVEEMKELGIVNAHVDDKCYVYGSIPATKGCEGCPAIGFVAHMDTAPDFNGNNVKPQVIKNYDGKDVKLKGRELCTADFPHLPGLKGRTLITTDGTSLLGADDKAGVAEILAAAEEVIKEGKPHGKICIAFTPDEEIGRGADYFNIEEFGAEYAYTLDGGPEGEISYENFNAAAATLDFNGVNVHPGDAKNIMRNAQLVAMEFNSMLPSCETPAQTEKYEGFYHLTSMEGNIEHAKLKYIVRDHDAGTFADRERLIRHIVKILNEKYGEGTVKLTYKESYRNMKEKLTDCMHLIENAKKALTAAGAEVCIVPVRGGTDGARLSYMGLPCPNLGTGGYAFHGPMEHITVEGMDIVVEAVKNIVEIYAAAR